MWREPTSKSVSSGMEGGRSWRPSAGRNDLGRGRFVWWIGQGQGGGGVVWPVVRSRLEGDLGEGEPEPLEEGQGVLQRLEQLAIPLGLGGGHLAGAIGAMERL